MRASLSRRVRSFPCAALIIACALSLPPPASAQVPPAATPGAVLPRTAPVPPPPSTSPAEPIAIPRVSERPLGLEEGPRILVRSFRLSRAKDMRRYRIRVADAQKILDDSLRTQPANGYTINQLQALAGKVADYYHRKGLVLAQAYVPAQKVTDGIVTVEVLVGTLRSIRTEGNKWYSSRTLLRPFKGLMDEPVDKDELESALLTVANYPGISAFGVLSAGQELGATKLTLRVQNERRYGLDVLFDNEGAPYAGQYRAQVGVSVNDPLGFGDRLELHGLYEFHPAEAHGTYGGLDYAIPLFSPDDSLLLSYSTNSYVVGNVSAEIAATHPEGDSQVGEVGYRHDLPRSRLGSASFGIAFDVKRATFRTSDVEQFRDDLTTVRANFTWNRIDTRFRGVNQIALDYEHGFKGVLGSNGDLTSAAVPSSRFGATGEFNRVTLALQRLQRITSNTSLLLRVTGQQSSDLLMSLEQLSLTGPDAVRAYPVADALVDKGAVGTAEFIVGAPGFARRPAFAGRSWGQVLQFSVFADYGIGSLNPPVLDAPRSFHLGAWGGAVQFNIPGRIFARVDVATPFATSVSPGDFLQQLATRDPEYFFRVGFSL